MSKQYHYVVMYDTETEEFSVDVDTRLAVMPNGAVWTESQGWITDDEDSDNYVEIEDSLAKLIWGGSN